MATTGQLIRKARKYSGMTQAELAEALGVTNFLVCHWEANRKPVTDLAAVAQALGCQVEAITGDGPAPASQQKPNRRDYLPPETMRETTTPNKHFVNMTNLLRFIHASYGMRVEPGRIYEWIAERNFPAYRNPLKRNPQGEPTMLFHEPEVAEWISQAIQPINPVTPNRAPDYCQVPGGSLAAR